MTCDPLTYANIWSHATEGDASGKNTCMPIENLKDLLKISLSPAASDYNKNKDILSEGFYEMSSSNKLFKLLAMYRSLPFSFKLLAGRGKERSSW